MNRLRRDEAGASLVIVLVLISVFGLILSALLTEASASIQYTKTVDKRESKVYAADAGVSLAIQQVRQNNELCPEPGSTATVPLSTAINGQNVSVTCTGTTGSALGGRGFAIQVRESSTGTPGTLHSVSGSGADKIVKGPVFVDGTVDLQASVSVQRGRFYHKSSSCNAASLPSNLTLETSLGYSYVCTSTAPVALPTNDPPPSGVPAAAPTATTDASGCKTFYPGTYTTMPTLATDNYFVSGVYYFNFAGTLALDGKWVYGGVVGASETRVLDDTKRTVPACAKVSNPSGYTGTGVKIILGNTAAFNLSKGHMELFARQDASGVSPAPSGTNGISIVAVPSSWTGWTPSTAGTAVVDLSSNLNNSDLSLHGLIWARDQRVNLGSVNGAVAQALGGIVANYVDLQSSASAGDAFEVSVVAGDPDPRYVKLEATVSESGAKDVKSTAIIVLDNNIDTAPTIQSWRTRGIGENT